MLARMEKPFPKVSETALWTSLARLDDARSKRPVVNDTFAERFADAPRTALVKELLALSRPTASILSRHRYIDDVVRREPAKLVVVLGAGLDTRAFRLGDGSRRFVEVDHPELLAWKEARLPTSEAKGTLERVAVDFSKQTLASALAHLATPEPVLVVAEGLLMYLTPSDARTLVETLRTLFPNHTLVADLFSAAFIRKFSAGVQEVLAKHGTAFVHHPESSVGFFEENGYRDVEAQSSVELMMAAKGERVPRFVRWLFRGYFDLLEKGNVVCTARTTR